MDTEVQPFQHGRQSLTIGHLDVSPDYFSILPGKRQYLCKHNFVTGDLWPSFFWRPFRNLIWSLPRGDCTATVFAYYKKSVWYATIGTNLPRSTAFIRF